MNRAELIEEIKEYTGTVHESVQDYITDSTNAELEFFLWRLKNNWCFYDSHERFIHSKTLKVLSREDLLKMYRQGNKLHPVFENIINEFFKY